MWERWKVKCFKRQDFITIRLTKFQTKVAEKICVVLNISKKKWCILIKTNTYFKSSNQSSVDIFLANWPKSYHKLPKITTRLSDCHKLILTFFCFYSFRLSPKTIAYRNFRYFETKDFFYELENKLCPKECNGGIKYDDLPNIFDQL